MFADSIDIRPAYKNPKGYTYVSDFFVSVGDVGRSALRTHFDRSDNIAIFASLAANSPQVCFKYAWIGTFGVS